MREKDNMIQFVDDKAVIIASDQGLRNMQGNYETAI